jgi:hypothetical protein
MHHYQMFTNQTFPQLPKKDLDLIVYQAIKQSKLHRIAAHSAIFPCAEAISWIVRHAHINNRQIINAQGRLVASFQPSVLISCYQLTQEEMTLDDELVKGFPHKPRDLMKKLWVPGKKFKTRASNDYPTNLLRPPYQYAVAMLSRLYGEPDAQKFRVSWVPLIYYITTSRSVFNRANILSSTLARATSAAKHMAPGKYPSFHMVSYLLDMMCIIHTYTEMGWAW